MENVTDPDGVRWRVRRWWWKTVPWETGFATLDGTQASREQVRGWGPSGQRVAELAEQAQAGTLARTLELTEPQ